jgi:hypothetical protein
MITLQINVYTPQAASESFEVSAATIPEAFAKIPGAAACKGYGLISDGTPVQYTVRIVPHEPKLTHISNSRAAIYGLSNPNLDANPDSRIVYAEDYCVLAWTGRVLNTGPEDIGWTGGSGAFERDTIVEV